MEIPFDAAEKRLIEMDALASGRSIPMLRKTMIVLATAAALYRAPHS